MTLKQARRFREKTQNDIAVILNCCKDTYKKLEKNPEKTTIEQAKKISEYLKIDMDNIIFFNPDSSLNRDKENIA